MAPDQLRPDTELTADFGGDSVETQPCRDAPPDPGTNFVGEKHLPRRDIEHRETIVVNCGANVSCQRQGFTGEVTPLRSNPPTFCRRKPSVSKAAYPAAPVGTSFCSHMSQSGSASAHSKTRMESTRCLDRKKGVFKHLLSGSWKLPPVGVAAFARATRLAGRQPFANSQSMWMMPRRMATATALVRSRALSLGRIFFICPSTVSSLMCSRRPIS